MTQGNNVGYIKLIHWKEEEAAERAERIAACGYQVDSETPRDGSALRVLSKSPPRAVVIDLTRLPSQGRDVALALRTSAATRHVPIVFVEGEPEKVARTKASSPQNVSCRNGHVHFVVHPLMDYGGHNADSSGRYKSSAFGLPTLRSAGSALR